MAKIPNGIHGHFIGKLGILRGSYFGGVAYVDLNSKPAKIEFSKSQKVSQMMFAFIMSFSHSFYSILLKSVFRGFVPKLTPLQSFLSINDFKSYSDIYKFGLNLKFTKVSKLISQNVECVYDNLFSSIQFTAVGGSFISILDSGLFARLVVFYPFNERSSFISDVYLSNGQQIIFSNIILDREVNCFVYLFFENENKSIQTDIKAFYIIADN